MAAIIFLGVGASNRAHRSKERGPCGHPWQWLPALLTEGRFGEGSGHVTHGASQDQTFPPSAASAWSDTVLHMGRHIVHNDPRLAVNVYRAPAKTTSRRYALSFQATHSTLSPK
jgi:hypothetical protein